METSAILDELEILVADKHQAVSYKWVSREFVVSSNVAKRLLQEFVNTRKKNFQVVYTIAGWLKENPTNYRIKLIPDAKLEETKREYNGHCSVHVYSVQSCLPKDFASLRDNEFAQSEELSKQPSNILNCLRDNRFGAIAAPFVKREIDGAPSISYADSKAESSKSTKLQQCTTCKAIKPEAKDTENHVEDAKPPLPAVGKVSDFAKSSSKGNSLANMWGRASDKSKSITHNSAASSDAQIRDMEFINDDLFDDDKEEITLKRSDRKRRVVFDFSDDEAEELISLPSPEQKIMTEKPVSNEPSKLLVSVTEERTDDTKENDRPKSSPKKRKVLKTRIDDRGIEVTEVIYECEDTAAKIGEKQGKDTAAKIDEKQGKDTAAKIDEKPKSEPVAKKTLAAGNKTHSKKGGNSDPKQGKIFSFFKKA